MSHKRNHTKENVIDTLLSFRVWVLILFIIASIVAINYTFDRSGVVINGVTPASPAEDSGI